MWQRVLVLGAAAVVVSGATANAQQVSFRTAVTDGLFSGAESVTVADVDNDGNLDLLFPTGQGGVITILWGAGDGTFDAEDTCNTGRVPVGVAVANFDGDPNGIPDIAAVDSNSRQVVVMKGMGGREFNCDVAASDTGITSPSAVATADFSGDGIPDLAIASGESGGGSVAVLLGVGDGTFVATDGSPFPTGPNTRSVVIDFVNDDLLPDIIATNRDALPGTVSALINLGLGAFQPAISSNAGESPQAAATGDFDGDGKLDVVVANRGSDRFTLLKGDGTGAFTSVLEVPAGIFPSAIVADDFDGDQKLDVAVANNVSYDVTVAYGDGHGNFPVRRAFLGGALPAGIGSGKFNADPMADLVVLNKTGEGDAYNLLLADTGRTFFAIENVDVSGSPTAIAVGDINGDARPDAVVAAGPHLAVLIPDGSGHVAVTGTDLATAVNSVVLADVNRDGHSDLLLTRSGDEEQNDFFGVALGDGHGGFKPLQFSPVGLGASGIVVSDFNADGQPDAALTEGLDNTVRILLGDGNGGFTTVGDFTVRPPDATGHCSSTTGRSCDFPEDCPTGEQCVFDQYFPRAAVADYLNDDGTIDLAVVNYARGDKVGENALSLFFGHGDGMFDAAKVIAAGRRPLAIISSDLNNDGIMDLVTANEDQDAGLLIFKGTGGGNYQTPLTLTAGANPAGLALRDIDNDGFIDSLTVDRTGERVAIRRGRTSSPYFGAQVASCPQSGCFDTGRTPVAVVAGDFNDDGSYDLLVANNAGDNVSLVLNNKASALPAPGRGDANGDGRLSAADITAVMRTITDPALRANNRAVEDVVRTAGRLGQTLTAALDADGDGIVGITDAIGVVARVFRG